MESIKGLIDSELLSLISNSYSLRLRDKIEYALLSEGKRLRPFLVILSAESVGGRRDDVRTLALAIELIHTATLIHDDVLDRDVLRRGSLAVHARWSVHDAILVGDALLSIAIKLAASYGKEVLLIAADTGLSLCDGEYVDMDWADSKMAEETYLEKIRKKSASLFKAAAQGGAMVAGGSYPEVDALAGYGECFGVAYQIRDDLTDIFSLKGLSVDLKERRVTLPIIHLYQSYNSREKRNLLRSLKAIKSGGDLSRIFLKKLESDLRTRGSLKYCGEKIDEYVDRAIACVEPLKEDVYKSYLIKFAKSLRIREGNLRE